MPSFADLLNRLTPAEKAWLGTIGPRDHGWTVEDIVKELRQKTGEDVDPAGVVEYLQRNGLPVHPASEVATSPSADFSGAMERGIEQALVSQLDALGLRLFIDQDGRSGQQYAAVNSAASILSPPTRTEISLS